MLEEDGRGTADDDADDAGVADDTTTCEAADDGAFDDALADDGTGTVEDATGADEEGDEDETAAGTTDEETDDVVETIDNEDACDESVPPDAEDEDDDAHETIFHVHVSVQILPHDGCDDAVEPVPVSHSSPTGCVTMPSPQRTFVHDCVQFGPLPFRDDSSHSSPSLRTPLPHCGKVCPRRLAAPTAATTAKSATTTSAERRVSTGKLFRKRTAPSSA